MYNEAEYMKYCLCYKQSEKMLKKNFLKHFENKSTSPEGKYFNITSYLNNV